MPVEILGTAAPDDPAPRGGRGVQAPVDLDLGTALPGVPVLDGEPPADDATADDATAAAGAPSPVGEALRAVASPQALGLAALVIDLIGFAATAPASIWIDYSELTTEGGPQNPYSGLLRYLAVVAAVGMVLGVAGLLRLRREPGAVARMLTGAAVLVSALLLVYTGVTMLRLGSLSELG